MVTFSRAWLQAIWLRTKLAALVLTAFSFLYGRDLLEIIIKKWGGGVDNEKPEREEATHLK